MINLNLRRCIAVLSSALIVGITAAGCAAEPENAGNDPEAPIVVWTDATRQAGFESFAESHPEYDLEISVVPGQEIASKVLLFNQAGEGWPDVAFVPPSAADPFYEWAAPLGDKVPETVLAEFGKANQNCEFDGEIYCLVNDISQVVLWYNAPLMAEFGYSVPATWEEYAALGERLATEHPGYVIGSAGDSFLWHSFFKASGCPVQDVQGPDTVKIDTSDPRCVRMAEMLDPLIEAGSVSKLGTFSAEYAALANEGKVLMQPGSSWFGEYVFGSDASWAWPDGSLAAAPYPGWRGEEPITADSGGGAYVVSRHAKNMDGALALAEWMATDEAYQATQPSYPAFAPMAEKWGERLSADPLYAEDPMPVLSAASEQLGSGNAGWVRYDIEGSFARIVGSAVAEGKTIASVLPQLGQELTNLAQASAYTVVD